MSNYSVSLKGIGIENFKAFGEYQHFDLAPITIITGPNNSGKSALVAALELLSKSDIYSHLEFHSSNLEIGDIIQVINTKSKSKYISIHLNFDLYSRDREMLGVDYSNCIVGGKELPIHKGQDGYRKNNYEKYIESCTYEVDLAFDKVNGKLRKILIKLKEEDAFSIDLLENIFFINYKLFETLHNFKGKPFTESNPELNKFEAFILNYLNSPIRLDNDFFPLNPFGSTDKSMSMDLIERIIGHFTNPNYWESDEDCTYYVDIFAKLYFEDYPFFKYDKHFTEFLRDIKEDIVNILTESKVVIQSACKLEAQRASKQRLYLYQEKNIPLTREIIKAAENHSQSFDSNVVDLEKYLKKWTGNEGFNLFDDYGFILIPGVGYRFEVKINGEKRELPDLGFGTRQVIPVILGLFNNKGVPYIIEEPESNLHPRLQSLLADLFVEVKIPNPQLAELFDLKLIYAPLIIETHSEYLIRKLQYLVAKGKVKAEDIALSYISIEDKKLTVRKMEFRNDGILKQDFGEGFFDESMRLTRELLNLKIQN